MSDDAFIDEVTRALLMAEKARRQRAMDARTAKLRAELYPTHQEKRLRASVATRRAMAERGEPKGRWGESERDRALLALAGGEWLAHSDIGKRARTTTQKAQWLMAGCARLGLVEKVENADYAGKPAPSSPVKEQPKFLWRITRAGRGVVDDIQAHMGEVKPDRGFARLRARWERQRKAKKK